MALKPSPRDVLPAGLQEQARAALATSQEATASMPWFVRALSGFGAWMASWFLIAFLSIGVVVGEESFFFQEGHADRYEQAKYGELRVAGDGTSVLVGLRDAGRQPLGSAVP